MSESKTSKTFRGTILGGLGGAIGTAVTQPLDSVTVRLQAEQSLPAANRTIKGVASFLKALKEESTSMKTWGSVVPLRMLKAGIGSAAIFGTYTALNQRTKKASIYSDLKLNTPKFVKSKESKAKSTKPTNKKQRWTPLNSEARYVWSKLPREQKELVDTLIKHMSPRVRTHNKDYIIKELSKGKPLDLMAKKITTNPNVVL